MAKKKPNKFRPGQQVHISKVDEKITELRKQLSHFENLKALKAMPYKDYLQTRHWRQMRNKALKLADRQCIECNTKFELQVHHKHYRTLGEEDPVVDLRVLCAHCHRAEHGIEETGEDKKKTAAIIDAHYTKLKNIADKKFVRAMKNQAKYLARLHKRR